MLKVKRIFTDFMTNGASTVDSPYRTGQTNGNKGTLIVHSQQRVSFLTVELNGNFNYFGVHLKLLGN